MSEKESRGASDLRKRYWQEHGRPPEGEGPHPDMGGPAYIPWLEGLVTQLEAELAGMVLMEAEAESFAEDIVAENERLRKLINRR